MSDGNSSIFAFYRTAWSQKCVAFQKLPRGYKFSLKKCYVLTLSESITVCNRWAIVKTVQWANFVLIVCWMNLSVSASTLAVASSITKTILFLRMALARHTIWRWPTLRVVPPSVITSFKQSESNNIYFTTSRYLSKACFSSLHTECRKISEYL